MLQNQLFFSLLYPPDDALPHEKTFVECFNELFALVLTMAPDVIPHEWLKSGGKNNGIHILHKVVNILLNYNNST